LTEGILATITTMGNMFLHSGQVIDFRVQRCPNQGCKLWNSAAIVSIKGMNKSSWFYRKGNKQLAPLLPSELARLYQQMSEFDGPGPASGATSNDRNERKTL
jgi:hypothetical protein